jgi:hypothetical protein
MSGARFADGLTAPAGTNEASPTLHSGLRKPSDTARAKA